MPDLSVFEPDVQSGSFSVNGSPFDGYDLAVSPPAYGSEGKTPGGFAGTSPMEPANDFAVRGPTDLGIKVNPTGLTDPSTPTIMASPGAPFDYSKLSSGEPQLMPPTEKFSTPYYAARTNDGDLAGAVMVADNQKVRMVDRTNGDVVFEGVGPEGAKQATAIANAMSQDKGRKAAWAIEADNGQGGYTVQAAERYDPKKPGLVGKLLPIAAAVLGSILLPGVGTALGLGGLTTAAGGATALGAGLGAATGTAGLGVARGDPLKDILINSAISGIGAGVVGPAVNRFATGITGGGIGPLTPAGTPASLLNPLPGNVNFALTPADLASGIGAMTGANVAPLTVGALGSGALSSAAPSALGAAAGALAGAAGNNVQPGGQGNDTIPTTDPPLNPGETQLTEVVARGQTSAELAELAGRGITFEQMLQMGIPAAAAGAAIMAVGGLVSNNAAVAPPGNVPLTSTPASITAPPQGLLEAIKAGNVPGWIAANPLQAASLGLTAASIGAGLFGGNGSNGNFMGGVGPNGSAGTAGSLDPIFRAQLPASRFAVPRQQNNMSGVDFARYGQGPQQNFFKPPGMRRGGEFAVKGGGDGRADHVPAMLSDGEYVIDAETVALLGNGSSKAGADALDKFRIGVRKHKGKSLAAGKFSVKAKRPEAYVKGAR